MFENTKKTLKRLWKDITDWSSVWLNWFLNSKVSIFCYRYIITPVIWIYNKILERQVYTQENYRRLQEELSQLKKNQPLIEKIETLKKMIETSTLEKEKALKELNAALISATDLKLMPQHQFYSLYKKYINNGVIGHLELMNIISQANAETLSPKIKEFNSSENRQVIQNAIKISSLKLFFIAHLIRGGFKKLMSLGPLNALWAPSDETLHSFLNHIEHDEIDAAQNQIKIIEKLYNTFNLASNNLQAATTHLQTELKTSIDLTYYQSHRKMRNIISHIESLLKYEYGEHKSTLRAQYAFSKQEFWNHISQIIALKKKEEWLTRTIQKFTPIANGGNALCASLIQRLELQLQTLQEQQKSILIEATTLSDIKQNYQKEIQTLNTDFIAKAKDIGKMVDTPFMSLWTRIADMNEAFFDKLISSYEQLWLRYYSYTYRFNTVSADTSIVIADPIKKEETAPLTTTNTAEPAKDESNTTNQNELTTSSQPPVIFTEQSENNSHTQPPNQEKDPIIKRRHSF